MTIVFRHRLHLPPDASPERREAQRAYEAAIDQLNGSQSAEAECAALALVKQTKESFGAVLLAEDRSRRAAKAKGDTCSSAAPCPERGAGSISAPQALFLPRGASDRRVAAQRRYEASVCRLLRVADADEEARELANVRASRAAFRAALLAEDRALRPAIYSRRGRLGLLR